MRHAGPAQLADLGRGDGCSSPRRAAMLASDAAARLADRRMLGVEGMASVVVGLACAHWLLTVIWLAMVAVHAMGSNPNADVIPAFFGTDHDRSVSAGGCIRSASRCATEADLRTEVLGVDGDGAQRIKPSKCR